MEEHVYHHLRALEDAHWWFRGRRAVIWALLGNLRLPAAPRILDAGCGTGGNLAEFGRLGPAAGVDPSAVAVELCRERGLDGVVCGRIEEMPFADGSFDLLMATDVLEHVEDDRRAATELRRVAAPDSRLIITVPAYRWLWGQHDDTHHHVRRYTRRELHAVLSEAGWKPIRETYFNTILLVPIALVRMLRRGRLRPGARSDYDLSGGPLNSGLTLPMRAEAWLLARGGRLPAGVSIAMLCRPA